MTVKIPLIVSMLFFCGCLLVVIPPALSINCYRAVCEGEYCYGDVGEVECQGDDDDGCGTLTFTTEGSVHNVIKNCTRSTQDCNQESTCERVETAVAEWGVSFSDCSITCCQGNMCNAPEEAVKLEEADDHALGPIASMSIHNQKNPIKAYHVYHISGEGLYSALSILSRKDDGGCKFYHNTMRTLYSLSTSLIFAIFVPVLTT